MLNKVTAAGQASELKVVFLYKAVQKLRPARRRDVKATLDFWDQLSPGALCCWGFFRLLCLSDLGDAQIIRSLYVPTEVEQET